MVLFPEFGEGGGCVFCFGLTQLSQPTARRQHSKAGVKVVSESPGCFCGELLLYTYQRKMLENSFVVQTVGL